ncbi:MAG: DUF1778 domain-containing protein [Thermoplasmata archaeon]|nr:DUF1778 domain-containing protein [Thermoplasmata archaeon]
MSHPIPLSFKDAEYVVIDKAAKLEGKEPRVFIKDAALEKAKKVLEPQKEP